MEPTQKFCFCNGKFKVVDKNPRSYVRDRVRAFSLLLCFGGWTINKNQNMEKMENQKLSMKMTRRQEISKGYTKETVGER